MAQQQMASTFLVVLLSLVGAGVATQLEAQSKESLVAGSAPPMAKPTVLRDHLLFLWVAGGSILGGYVAVALRNITGLRHVVKYFAVSVASSLAVSPYVLVTWFSPSISPEVCFILGFLFAVVAWLAWEVLGILALRLKRAAQEQGWLGVKDELLGKPTGNKKEE